MSAIPKRELVKKRIKQTYEGYPAVTSVWQDPELEAMPDAPVEAPDTRSIDSLMVAATTPADPAARPIVEPTAPAREAYYGYIPDAPARSVADEYETAANLGLAKNIMAMGGLNGGTDPEAYVKARLSERARYEDLLNAHNTNKEAMDPASATAQGQQAYLQSMGVDASGLGAQNINALGVPQRASNLELKNKDIEYGLQKTQMENAAKIEAAKLKKGGGGSGVARGPAKWANPDGSVNWESPEAKDALSKTGNNKITAEKFLRNPKFGEKVDVAVVKEGIKDPDQLRKLVIDYGKDMDTIYSLKRAQQDAVNILKKVGNDVPGAGAVDRFTEGPRTFLAEQVGVGDKQRADSFERLKRSQMMMQQYWQRLTTGLAASIPEQIRNDFLAGLAPGASDPSIRRSVELFGQIVSDLEVNAKTKYGPEVASQYEANRKSTQGATPAAQPAQQQFVTVRHRGTGAVKQYTPADFERLSRKPSFADFEVVK
jgi:hypothetical protein